MEFEIRPYLLQNKIQHYAWGTRNEHAFIPRLLGLPVEKDVPYAELWMGTHPNAPSEVVMNGEKLPLQTVIQHFPEKILGQKVVEQFGPQLPFLFKVLSAGEALSIQAHPNKKQAEILHKRDPQHYPDDNHKPEIAIALDHLSALVGFRTLPEIALVLQTFPEIVHLAEMTAYLPSQGLDLKTFKRFFQQLMQRAETQKPALEKTLQSMEEKILNQKERNERDRLFLELRRKYRTDVGLISIYLLNLLHLQKGQGVFLKAGVPHAYLKGNIVECMANSDNVVRAGLTPKFKDVQTLVEILTYETGPVEIYDAAALEEFEYHTPVNEFRLKRWNLSAGGQGTHVLNSVGILIVIKGQGELRYRQSKLNIVQGQAFLLPAVLKSFTLKAKQSFEAFLAYVS